MLGMKRLGGQAAFIALFCGAVWVTACGDDDASIPPFDAGSASSSSSSSSSSTSGASSSSSSSSGASSSSSSSSSSSGLVDGGNDSGSDSGSCTPGTACTTTGGANGVFDNACACAACDANGVTVAASDSICQAAYNDGTLCLSSSCVSANCRSTNGTPAPGCAAGQICGIGSPNQCGDCSVTADCTTVYGAGYVCSAAGACVQGNCSTSTDCDTGATAGQLCGATAANQCGACVNDAQCANDAHYSGAGNTICDTTSHKCVSATCSVTKAACDGTHLCCGTTCLAGTTFTPSGNNKSCCSAADCAATPGFTACVNNQCSACAAVADGKYYVDPASGTDNGASGGDSNGCRFKTITHALAVATLAAGTKTIYVIGDGGGASESFPLVLPPNVSVVGYDDVAKAPKQRKILVPAGLVGFRLPASNSGLSYLAIDGVNGASATLANRYATAVSMGALGSPTGIVIDHVSVANTASTGILASGTGTITVGPGVKVTNSGIVTTAPANGLAVTGTTRVTITGGATAADQTSFNKNSQHGVQVASRAGLTVNVTPVAGTGDYANTPVIASANRVAGLAIAQTPEGASTAAAAWTAMPTCAITGFVSGGTVAGNGIRILGGSKARLRSSVSFGNAADGVHIESGGSAATPAADANYIAAIDLGGGDGKAGANIFQVAYGNVGATYNKGAGICLAIAAGGVGAGAKLSATGNILVDTANIPADCAATAATVVKSGTCLSGAGAPASVGVMPVKNNTNTIDITKCK